MCTLPRNLQFFFTSHLMQFFRDSFEDGNLYKRFAGEGILLFQWLSLVLTAGWFGEALPGVRLL